MVIGLEVHAQLLTKSKLFCGDAAVYSTDPNTQVSAVSLGYPGTLPVLNREAIVFAIRAGLACHCSITRHNYFARKHYFYPDLPKGYQLSQHTTPICTGGYVQITTGTHTGNIRLNRIHMEEDAGKSMHDVADGFTAIDYNRAGVCLLEIVTEPDLRSGAEAYSFLTELRRMLRYLGICDGNMEEGSMRCDANISVRRQGESKLGTKVEVKNLNSIRNVRKAIEHEAERLVSLAEQGQAVTQQTRSFDADKGRTFAIRDKEEADDYRYFADPDLPAFVISEKMISEIAAGMPLLQDQRIKNYLASFGITEYDARVITEEREYAEYFESLTLHTRNYKAAANWMLGPVKSWLNESGLAIGDFPISPPGIAELISLVDEGKTNFSVAASRIFPAMLKDPAKRPATLAGEMNLLQETDLKFISDLADEVMAAMPAKVEEYRKGKKGLIGLFVGELMKRSRGKADPKVAGEILAEKLKNQ